MYSRPFSLEKARERGLFWLALHRLLGYETLRSESLLTAFSRFVLTIATKAVIINRWAVTFTLFIKSFVGTVNWAGIITQMNLKMCTVYWTKAEKPSRTSLWCCFFYVVQSESWFQVWPFKQTHFKITSLYLIKNEANCWGFRDIHLRENRKTWLSRCKKIHVSGCTENNSQD